MTTVAAKTADDMTIMIMVAGGRLKVGLAKTMDTRWVLNSVVDQT